jgi:hypothetical protein
LLTIIFVVRVYQCVRHKNNCITKIS